MGNSCSVLFACSTCAFPEHTNGGGTPFLGSRSSSHDGKGVPVKCTVNGARGVSEVASKGILNVRESSSVSLTLPSTSYFVKTAMVNCGM